MQLSFTAFSTLNDSPVFTIDIIIYVNFLIIAFIDTNLLNLFSLCDYLSFVKF